MPSLQLHRSRARDDDEVVEVNLESDEERKPAATAIPSIDLEFDPKPKCCCVKRITVMRVLLFMTSAITLVFACALIFLVHDMEKKFTVAKKKALAALNMSVYTTLSMNPGDLDPKNMFLTLEFTAIFILILALAGFWSAGTRRKNVIIFFMCYLLISFTLLVYAIVYTYEFHSNVESFWEVFNIVLDGFFKNMVKGLGIVFVVCLLLVIVEFVVSVVILGCTTAVAALVMVFNMATGIVGFVFIALASFLLLESETQQWSAIVLGVTGALTTGISLLGFRVAEVVLAKARHLREVLVHGENARPPEPDAVGTKKCFCLPCCCLVSQVWASVYLGAMAIIMIVLIVNAGIGFVFAANIKNYVNSRTQNQAEFLVQEYFFRIATGSILLLVMLVFNFGSSLYLFYLAFMQPTATPLRGTRDGVAAVTRAEDEGAESDELPPAPPEGGAAAAAAASTGTAEQKADDKDFKFVGDVLRLLEDSELAAASARAREAEKSLAENDEQALSKYAVAVADAIGMCCTVNKDGKVEPLHQDLEQVLDILSRHHMTSPRSAAAVNLRRRELEAIGADV